MRGLKICFCGEMRKIIPKLSMLPLLIWSFVFISEFTRNFFFINGKQIKPKVTAHYIRNMSNLVGLNTTCHDLLIGAVKFPVFFLFFF